MTPKSFSRTRVLPVVLSFCLIFVFPTATFAWGDKGHQIIGALAWENLSESAKRQVMELLPEGAKDPNGPLAAVGSWADRQALANPSERSWHFVSIPLSAQGYDRERDCGDGNCIVAKLDEKKYVLQTAESRLERAQALKYVIHLVGDIHQPLHCTNNNDKGGNERAVRFLGEPTSLHRIWDFDMIEASKLSVADYVKKLKAVEVPKGFWIEHWANDSHDIAQKYVYAIPRDNELGNEYYRRNLPVLEKQLAGAADKLVQILEEALKPRTNNRARKR